MRNKREGDDHEAINRQFAPEFRNRPDAIISFAHLNADVIGSRCELLILPKWKAGVSQDRRLFCCAMSWLGRVLHSSAAKYTNIREL
jgi:hypothetical protein